MRYPNRHASFAAAAAVLGLLVSSVWPARLSAQPDQTGGSGESVGPDEAVDLDALYQEAAENVHRNRFERALELYRQIAEHDPSWADVWYNLGEVSRVAEHHADCVLYFRGYLARDPASDERPAIEATIERCAQEIDGAALLVVSATPETASISVDGVKLGEGSVEPVTLAPGQHLLRVGLADYLPHEQQLEVVPDTDLILAIALEPMTLYGSLRLVVNVDGAAVTAEERALGTTPIAEPLRLQVGEYLVRLSKPGYYDWVRRITIERDTEYQLEVEMQRSDD
jgi:hypothetical protein